MTFDAQKHIRSLFTTPLGSFKVQGHEQLNLGLKKAILEKEAAEPGVNRSNAGGWHSAYDLMTWPLPEVEALGDLARQGALAVLARMLGHSQVQAKVMMQAWANVSRRENYNKMHYHPSWHISAVYYVEAGQPGAGNNPESGCIEFSDPRGAIGMMDLPGSDLGKTFRLPPETGVLLVFPAWLQHWVHPYYGEDTRISIAINMKMKDIEVIEEGPGRAAVA